VPSEEDEEEEEEEEMLKKKPLRCAYGLKVLTKRIKKNF